MSALRPLRPRNTLLDHPPCLVRVAPADHLHPFAFLEILVVLEEVLDLFADHAGQVGVVLDGAKLGGDLVGGNGDDLFVLASLVLHDQHADRADGDVGAWHQRPRVRNQHVDRIAVA